MADEKNPRNLPSTFQQVLENMRNIQDTILPVIELLNKTIFNPDRPGSEGGDFESKDDLVLDEDGRMKVIGITIVRDKQDEDTKPGSYVRNITFELKNARVIGLGGKSGISLDYVMVMTVSLNNDPSIVYPAWQCAYGDRAMTMYYRQAVDDDTWGNWVRVFDLKDVLKENPDIFEELSHRQIIEADSQPDNQLPGDYWLQPIYPQVPVSSYFLQTIGSEITEITEINEETRAKFNFTDLSSGVIVAPGDEHDYIMIVPTQYLPGTGPETDKTEEGTVSDNG